MPDIDELTPEHLKDFMDASKRREHEGLYRFLLHVWNHEKYSFSPGETASWPSEDLKVFADWLTDAMQPCRVFRPDRHEELWELESMIPDPQFARVENKFATRA